MNDVLILRFEVQSENFIDPAPLGDRGLRRSPRRTKLTRPAMETQNKTASHSHPQPSNARFSRVHVRRVLPQMVATKLWSTSILCVPAACRDYYIIPSQTRHPSARTER